MSTETKYLYHATEMKNLYSILDNGILPGVDGLAYMSDTEVNAAKFLFIRGCKSILVFRINMNKLDHKLLQESFDHSPKFFQCRAWSYAGNIPNSAIDRPVKFDLTV